MKAHKQRWPDKVMTTWLQRIIPLFTTESILKLIQAYLSWVEEVNENRKRQREALKTDINRKKKIIDDINQKRLAQQDSYNTLLLTSQADMGWFPAHSVEYIHMETKLDAQSAAFQIAQQILMTHELQIRDELRNLELDYPLI